MAKGSLLWHVLANLNMEYFDTDILPNVGEMAPLLVRYMDDCFVISPNDRDFRPFLLKFNDAVPSIKFSVE